MAADAFTPDNTTPRALGHVFDAAMYDTTIDADGDLVVLDKYKVLVAVHERRFVRFLVVFALRDEALDSDVLLLVNRVNDRLICLRATANRDHKAFLIDWYLPLFDTGLSRKAVIRSFRLFTELLGAIGDLDEDDVLG